MVVLAAHLECCLQVLLFWVENLAGQVEGLVHAKLHGAREHHDHLVAAFLKRLVQRDVVHQSAVEVLLAVDSNAMGDKGQRARCPQPIDLLIAVINEFVFCLSRSHIGYCGEDFGLGLLVGLFIEGG